jgi:antitoxin ParD1/3/4/toxin ParE1/3/4
MSEFILSPAARLDLIEIWDFIAQDNIDAADRVRDEMLEAMAMLAAEPGLGHYRKDLADEPLRFWRVYSYLIIYRPESRPLEIVRVLTAYRNVKELLG